MPGIAPRHPFRCLLPFANLGSRGLIHGSNREKPSLRSSATAPAVGRSETDPETRSMSEFAVDHVQKKGAVLPWEEPPLLCSV
jgi:hypothetical protein